MIDFQGSKYSTSEELLSQSGIKIGGQFFAVSTKAVEESLLKLKTIKDVSVQKNFPGVITVKIEEFPAVAYELEQEAS